jgi:N4-(beta-N-acetylglucosaminyl)-L-asparaginase
MIMDGKHMKVGAVAAMREIKEAIAVARHVLDYTKHTLLVGDQATEFAIKMGFTRQNLSTARNDEIMSSWRSSNCQPNYWINVVPKSSESCGPYEKDENAVGGEISVVMTDDSNHDTIGMVAIDGNGNVAAGTSTNGLTYKIPGRVGDSPIPVGHFHGFYMVYHVITLWSSFHYHLLHLHRVLVHTLTTQLVEQPRLATVT